MLPISSVLAVVADGQAVAVDEVVAMPLRQARRAGVSKLRPPSRVRLTTSAPSTGTRRSSATPGTNQAVSASSGCTATAKPKLDSGALVTSCHDAALSVERQMPL